MDPRTRATTPSLSRAVDRLRQLRAEHGELLSRIAGDEGMAPETRRQLLLHLYAEEGERIAEIERLVPPTGETSSAEERPARHTDTPVLTVGSLRAVETWPGADPKTLGSLRNREGT